MTRPSGKRTTLAKTASSWRVRYHLSPLLRFCALALPTAVLAMALFHFGWEAVGFVDPVRLAPRFQFASWLLEAIGLVTLFLLLRSGERSRLADGLAAAWIAWIFRGPAVVLIVVGAANLPQQPWWRLSLGWLGLYTALGVALALIARRTGA